VVLVRLGSVHFVALDTEADYATQGPSGSTPTSQASTQPWKIVLHAPPAVLVGEEHGFGHQPFARSWRRCFEKHHVQLVPSTGHDHDYERMQAAETASTTSFTGGGGIGNPAGRHVDPSPRSPPR